jgi:carboxymethylenebutenolidase
LVLVVHENRGLNPHIEDIAPRLALDGFIAFAPDAWFTLGGYPGDEDQARALFGTLDQATRRAAFAASARWLQQQPELAAAVPFYCA